MTTVRGLLLGSLVATGVVLSAAPAHAAMQTLTALPAPNCGTPTTFTQTNNCITFGDFAVYSLGLLHVQERFAATGTVPTTNPTPGDAYYVASSPGELGNDGYIVYGTGTNNNNVVTNGAGTLIDDAQQNPTGTTSDFQVGAASETNPTFTGDDPAKWSATLSAMRAELGLGSAPDGQFVVYFNLNETGADGLLGIDLQAWFKVTLIDDDGVLPSLDFYLTGNPGSTTAPVLGNDLDPNWAYVHGTICVSSTAGFLGFGPCDATQKAAGGVDVNQNLGANTAAFAIFNQDLSDAVLNSGYDFLQAEWRFNNINNGYEQQFSALVPIGRDNDVPEPGSLALLGLGLLGLVAGRRRKQGAR